jgi:phage shock protein A
MTKRDDSSWLPEHAYEGDCPYPPDLNAYDPQCVRCNIDRIVRELEAWEKSSRGMTANWVEVKRERDEARAEAEKLRERAHEAAQDAHMEGRVYHGSGEVLGPAEEFERIRQRTNAILIREEAADAEA